MTVEISISQKRNGIYLRFERPEKGFKRVFEKVVTSVEDIITLQKNLYSDLPNDKRDEVFNQLYRYLASFNGIGTLASAKKHVSTRILPKQGYISFLTKSLTLVAYIPKEDSEAIAYKLVSYGTPIKNASFLAEVQKRFTLDESDISYFKNIFEILV